MQHSFTKNQVVWAKLKGYPWWPAVVAQIKGSESQQNLAYVVNFLNENSHSLLPPDKICEFTKNLELHGKLKQLKNKKLIDAIEMAKRIDSGKTSYEQEKKKFEKRKQSNNKEGDSSSGEDSSEEDDDTNSDKQESGENKQVNSKQSSKLTKKKKKIASKKQNNSSQKKSQIKSTEENQSTKKNAKSQIQSSAEKTKAQSSNGDSNIIDSNNINGEQEEGETPKKKPKTNSQANSAEKIIQQEKTPQKPSIEKSSKSKDQSSPSQQLQAKQLLFPQQQVLNSSPKQQLATSPQSKEAQDQQQKVPEDQQQEQQQQQEQKEQEIPQGGDEKVPSEIDNHNSNSNEDKKAQLCECIQHFIANFLNMYNQKQLTEKIKELDEEITKIHLLFWQSNISIVDMKEKEIGSTLSYIIQLIEKTKIFISDQTPLQKLKDMLKQLEDKVQEEIFSTQNYQSILKDIQEVIQEEKDNEVPQLKSSGDSNQQEKSEGNNSKMSGNPDVQNSPQQNSNMLYANSFADDKEKSNMTGIENNQLILQNATSMKLEGQESGVSEEKKISNNNNSNNNNNNNNQGENDEKQEKNRFRKKIYKKFCDILQQDTFAFEKEQAKQLTIKFEGKIKSLDPDIGIEYNKLIKRLHKILTDPDINNQKVVELSQLSKEELQKAIYQADSKNNQLHQVDENNKSNQENQATNNL